MADISLTLRGKPVDLPANPRNLVRLTQARAGLSDLTARIGEYSWPLTLPATRHNAGVFGPARLHPLGLGKFGADTDFDFVLTCGGEVFTGIFRLASLKDGYTGQLRMDGFSWAELLGERLLTDLQFRPIPYDGSQLESIQLLNCDTSDVQAPLIAWGNFFHPPVTKTFLDGSTEEESLPASNLLAYPLAVDDYPLCVYARNVLRQMFADFGYSLQGRLLDTDEARETLVTPAGYIRETAWPWGALMLDSASVTAPPARSYIYYNTGPGDRYTNNAVGFDDQGLPTAPDFKQGQVFFLPVPMTLDLTSPTRYIEGDKSRFTAPLAGTYTFQWSATLNGGYQTIIHDTSATGIYTKELTVFRRTGLGVVVLRGGAFEAVDGGWLSGDGPVDTDVLPPDSYRDIYSSSSSNRLAYGNYSGTLTVFLEAGDVVQFCTFAKRKMQSNPDDISLLRGTFIVEFSAATFACTHYEDNDGVSETQLYPARFLPQIKATDFLKDWLTRRDAVIVGNHAQRIATIMTRAELITAAGQPLDLTNRCNPSSMEALPTFGSGVGSVVFSPADVSDPLFPVPKGQKSTNDVVRVVVGTGTGEQAVGSLFAPVGFRIYKVQQGVGPFYRQESVSLPTIAAEDGLKTPLADVANDVGGMEPRLLRWVGPHATQKVLFQNRAVPVGVATWGGTLAWAGIGGAVATYYRATLGRGLNGHLVKIGMSLTPQLYRQLTLGRAVIIEGVDYTAEDVAGFDPADPATLTQVTLARNFQQ
jgi:hypothetical protein